jgi:hypothetical protein
MTEAETLKTVTLQMEIMATTGLGVVVIWEWKLPLPLMGRFPDLRDPRAVQTGPFRLKPGPLRLKTEPLTDTARVSPTLREAPAIPLIPGRGLPAPLPGGFMGRRICGCASPT